LTQLYDRWLAGTGLEAPQFALLMTLDNHGAVSQAATGPSLRPRQDDDVAQSEAVRARGLDHSLERGRQA
jgi:hypothetical protein